MGIEYLVEIMTVGGEDVMTLRHEYEKSHKQMVRLGKDQTCDRANADPEELPRRAQCRAGCVHTPARTSVSSQML